MAGGLTTAAAQLAAQAPAPAQGAPGPGRGAPLPLGTIEKIKDNLYWIQQQGGNTAVYVAADGVVLVDTKNPTNGQGILAQVKTVTDKPVTHIINTHTHADHNGSNAEFPSHSARSSRTRTPRRT